MGRTGTAVLAGYQAQVVTPRRSCICAILQRAQRLGLIDDEADIDVAVTLCTGSWYARPGRAAATPELAGPHRCTRVAGSRRHNPVSADVASCAVPLTSGYCDSPRCPR